MDRKESLKTMLLGTMSLPFFNNLPPDTANMEIRKAAEPMRSDWDQWPDMEWTGPRFWGNRLQDWQVRGGKARCSVSGKNRTLHCLTHQLGPRQEGFTTRVEVEVLGDTGAASDRVGLRLGATAEDRPVQVAFDDYRRDAVFGEGLEAGIQGDGRLFIGAHSGGKAIDIPDMVILSLSAEPAGGSYRVSLTARREGEEEPLDQLTADDIAPESLVGNLALLAHFPSDKMQPDAPSVRFSNWQIAGPKVQDSPAQTFGPICFAQYTQNRGTLKMTAQLAPIETIEAHEVELQIREKKRWTSLQTTTADALSRTAHFRQENWDRGEDISYRIKLTLPLNDRDKEFYYEGTIAANPVPADQLKMAVFSCNSHYGFPNEEVVRNVSRHRPDMAVFLGDQFYESHGGFGVQHGPLEKATLDFLRKWYMFGWSYRELFRDIPAVFIPDDHDVYHGNLWGEAGADAPVEEKGWGYKSQDEGGYKMPPEWVNMVQRAQTSNLPDPYDPSPVKQDIGVYYTDWNYGGISFGILEDRKFKSAPNEVLPFEVVNGFIQDPESVDITEYYDTDAELLGERQEQFLQEWAADWSGGATMKVVLSQSPFCSAHTLPEGATSDRIVPRRPIPPRGTYPAGDVPAADMDTNGWPQQKRDKALRILRKSFAFHVAGDQHLASMVQYGVEEYEDSGVVFTGPALNNVWPRRWWPQVGPDHQPLTGKAKNTGNFTDGFGNKMTVYAVGNPIQTNRKPALIYDRATGYGIVSFDKTERTAKIECWPRYVDPAANPEGQYEGWPLVIRQQDNYGRRPAGHLPTLQIEGLTDPVVEIYTQDNNDLVYALRIKGQSFTPKVFERSNYKIRVGEPDKDMWMEFEEVSPKDKEPILCKF